jgi:superfamily II DNA helicase RecQ
VGEAFGHGYTNEVGEVDWGDDGDDESPLELQNGRTTAIGTMQYGVSIDMVRHLSERSLATFRLLSEKWHRFLGFDDDGRKEEEEEEKKNEQETLLSRVKRRRSGGEQRTRNGLKRARNTPAYGKDEIRAVMQQVLKRTDVTFRSAEQERALHSVLDRHTPLVVVLPTGGGKSMLFMVAACLDQGTTVVVVPFRALVNDMLARLKAARIDHLEWRPGETNPAAVVVVSADMVSGTGFLVYASGLAERGHLRRVVVDECHLTLTASVWRPKLAQLRDLRVLDCQTVLLTATLPPVLERELSEAMLVRSATYIRASTVRPNIRYTVATCRGGRLVETALETCRRQRLEDKGVVYCRSKAQCEQIAEELGCSYYHAGTLDREERLTAWIASGGFIVATSALGTGVDIAGIEFVLHVDVP